MIQEDLESLVNLKYLTLQESEFDRLIFNGLEKLERKF